MVSTGILPSSVFHHSHSLEVKQLPRSTNVRCCCTPKRVRLSKSVCAILPFSAELVREKPPAKAPVVMFQWTATNQREDIVSRGGEDLEVLPWWWFPLQGPLMLRRRQFFLLSITIVAVARGQAALGVRAEETKNVEEDNGVLGSIQLFFDPNKKTKSGKILPKSYLKNAREVVRTLRESLKDRTEDIVQFRRSADAAKESIREYFGAWKGKETVSKEESYIALENALRTLARFYSKAGPSASLPEDVKNSILDDLNKAEASL